MYHHCVCVWDRELIGKWREMGMKEGLKVQQKNHPKKKRVFLSSPNHLFECAL